MIIDEFKKNVSFYPDRIAVKDKVNCYTYDELDRKSDEFATKLNYLGIGANDVVAVLCERSVEYLAIMLGIIKLHACYLPLDINLPSERYEYMIKNSRAVILITRLDLCKFDTDNVKVLLVEKINEYSSCIIEYSSDHYDNLAYILYTSGSTGKPKGAMIGYKGLENHLHAKVNDLHMDERSIIAQTASQGFDISIWQFLAPIIAGGKVVIYTTNEVKNISRFLVKISNDGVQILELVPSYLSVMMDIIENKNINYLNKLRYLVVTGEKFNVGLAKRILKKCQGICLVNAYGPTEAADDITHYIFSEIYNDEYIPLGKAIQNTQIYIVDDDNNICSENVKGEIWVSGDGVGKGYVNNDEMTKKFFVKNPFGEGRIYKTGDIGSVNADGNILFWGRKDNQVKLNGRRIELEEIEIVLGKYPLISNVCVGTIESNINSINSIVAFYSSRKEIPEKELQEYCMKYLPIYMIPTLFIYKKTLPMTQNNKIDRKLLLNNFNY